MQTASRNSNRNSAYFSAADTWRPRAENKIKNTKKRIPANAAVPTSSSGVSEASHAGPLPVRASPAMLTKKVEAPVMTRRKRWREDPELTDDASSAPQMPEFHVRKGAAHTAAAGPYQEGLSIDAIFPPAWFDRLPLSSKTLAAPVRLPARNPILSSKRMNPDYDKQHKYKRVDTDEEESYDYNARLEKRKAQESFANFREVYAFVTKPQSLGRQDAQRFKTHSTDVLFREFGAHVKETCRGLYASYSVSHVESADHLAFLVGRVADIEHRPKRTRVGAGSGSSGESGPSGGIWQDWYIIGVCALHDLDKRKWASERPDPGAVNLRARPAPPEFIVMTQGPIAYVSVICTVPGFGAEFLSAIEGYYGGLRGPGGYWGFALESVHDAYGFYYQHGYRAYDPVKHVTFVPLDRDYYINKASKKKRLAAYVSFVSNDRDDLFRLMKPSELAAHQAKADRTYGTGRMPWLGIM